MLMESGEEEKEKEKDRGVIASDMRKYEGGRIWGIKDVGDTIKWKCKTRMANTK